ncbi:hypothetical protein I6N90_01790 [Paenibacillus sp. GSMTC-2017]|nr:hypothetical protein [Paenibacillus sp. GSMTC-2017]MBH5316536.1 hypothetical protein [Paenibacillus sp. GSMTC-2017]
MVKKTEYILVTIEKLEETSNMEVKTAGFSTKVEKIAGTSALVVMVV